MRNLLSIIVLVVVLAVVGCGGNPLEVEEIGTDIIQLVIYRSAGGHPDPSLLILAKKITLDYSNRIILVEGLVNIVGDGWWLDSYEWVVSKIELRNNELIITIPEDTAYHVYVGEQYHYLPPMKMK